jgi:hypothetical protein
MIHKRRHPFKHAWLFGYGTVAVLGLVLFYFAFAHNGFSFR